MPDMYPPGEYDLAGFAVGAMERDQKLPQLERIAEGDVVVGVASSGLHSNGFSLVRKIVERSSLQYSSPAPDGCGDQTLGKPTLAVLPAATAGVTEYLKWKDSTDLPFSCLGDIPELMCYARPLPVIVQFRTVFRFGFRMCGLSLYPSNPQGTCF